MLRITRILVPTDFSLCADAALPVAEFLAKVHGAEIFLLHVLPDRETDTLLELHDMGDQVQVLEVLARKSELELRRRADHLAVRAHTRLIGNMGPPSIAIASSARELEAQLIVMATHGRRGFRRSLLGSVSEDVLRRAPCPVLLVRPAGAERGDAGSFHRMLVPIDFSWSSRMALTYARALASTHGATLALLHVVTDSPVPGFYSITPQMTQSLRQEVEVEAGRRLAELSDDVTRAGKEGLFVRFGHPAVEIVRFAREHGSDLILMASHGLGGILRLMLGSVTARVVHRAPCSVLVAGWGSSMRPDLRTLSTHYPDVTASPGPREPIAVDGIYM